MAKKVLFGLLVIMLLSSALIQAPQADLVDPESISVLMILGYSFGWSYFELLDILQEWGCDITTTGVTSHLQSCVNKEDRSIYADILVSEIEREDLGQYDVLIVPSGGHWQNLLETQSILNLITMAFEEGLIVSGVCVGVAPIAAANVTEGKLATGHDFVYPYIRDSGGTWLRYTSVVSDGNVITGDNGIGFLHGYEVAPHYDLCVAIMRKLFGISYFEDVITQIEQNGTDSVYYMNVTTSGPIHLFDNVTTPEISEVTAKLHMPDNDTVIATMDLTDNDNDAVFEGNITGVDLDDCIIDLEITDANVSMEVVRDASSFDAENITRTRRTTYSSLETIVIVGIATGLLVVFLAIFWRRKSGP